MDSYIDENWGLLYLPLSFWDYALESATHILNMVPTKKVDKTPYELWYGKVPNLSYLKVWGCEALVKRDTPDKLQQRSIKCIFIGYPKETMGYYFYFPPENKIVVARYAEFFNENPIITQEVSGRAINLEEIQDEDTPPSEITSEIPMEVEGFDPPQEEVILIRRSERTHRAPNRLCLNVEANEHSLGDFNEPTSYKATMLDLEFNKWIDAMNTEMQSMIDNMVWVLVDLPPKCKTVGTKGYTQLFGVDYEETFSPVADIRAIRILISIAAFYDYEIWKMDVKTAFLNGYLDEDIYIVQPEGFVEPNHPRKVFCYERFGGSSIYRMDNSKRGHISMQERADLNKTQGASTPEEVKRIQIVPYASAVGSIINTKDMFLAYGGNPEAELQVDCYCDARFKTDRDDTKSQTGYVFILNGGTVDWKSSKQSTTAMYATEAEYISCFEAEIGSCLD
ncbi:retrotransposon protein, putative, ty1-copia subclass [Tanacetum coccineum]|uniref:Retrotransposon protein, putative, ty1-copia subclass n=1 Tax=Tanacetum coccineum TaxID=301880 RepID=A0ABQ5I6S0_9ASTR